MNDIHQPPHFVGNNLGLDFINSAFGVGVQRHDCFVDDKSVLAWLGAAGVVSEDVVSVPVGLLQLAQSLREQMSQCLSAAKQGEAADVRVINQIFAQGLPVPQLSWDVETARFTQVDRPRDGSAASLLYPVVASLASLLTQGTLQHVHQCEAHDCTLTFLDTTKSKRRRWCSMALCGNRMKVASFRQRKQAENPE
ncbi:CGNR zinc finger domain-containing protein [Pectobacterium sp. B1J-3]|uniref:CGNR zinc finger domain-containing protein n=1 Tax=Pectobacterium sp. B1J-3 TaxID=3385371 RepID=UPI003906CA5A